MTPGLGEPNAIAIVFFLGFIVLSLGITVWAARKMRTAEHFYTAGRSVTALQNGLALAGDYMSAASFLGIAGLVALSGFDGLIYSVGWLVGWPIVMFLIAEPLRNLGRYTFADVVAARLQQVPVRIAAAIGSLAVISFYLIAQMVGAGNLIRLLFGLPYELAVVIVGGVMLVYVLFGGMIATTWVQIIKAVLLLERRGAAGRHGAGAVRVQPAGALRRGQPALRRRRAEPGPAGDRSGGRDLAGAGADAGDGGPAAHPDAVLHRARCEDRAHVGRLRDGVHRLLLSADLRARLRRHGDRRPRGDHGDRRRRQHGGPAPGGGRRRHAVPRLHLPPWRLRPSWRWSPA